MPAPGRRCGCQARRAGPRVPAIPPVERGPVHAELPQRAPCGQIRVLHEADDLAFLRCRQSHVSSPESDATRLFFKYAILEHGLGYDLLELAVLAAQVLDFR